MLVNHTKPIVFILLLGLVLLGTLLPTVCAISNGHTVDFGDEGYSTFLAVKKSRYIDGHRIWYYDCRWIHCDANNNILERHYYYCPLGFPI